MDLIHSRHLFEIVQRLTILGKDKFVEEEENRYERQIEARADEVLQHHVQLILISGPSGSGKTTTSHNLRKYLMKKLSGTERYV